MYYAYGTYATLPLLMPTEKYLGHVYCCVLMNRAVMNMDKQVSVEWDITSFGLILGIWFSWVIWWI